MDKVKLGIIGVGNMGCGHIGNLLKDLVPEIELVAVADNRETRRAWAKENLPESIAIFEDGDSLIDSGVCEAVLIAVPHYDHPTFAIKAFEKGLHVMCEKPAGVYTKQVREMNEAAAKTDKVFAMMFNQRTNHLYRKMKELVESGNYGKIREKVLRLLLQLLSHLYSYREQGSLLRPLEWQFTRISTSSAPCVC